MVIPALSGKPKYSVTLGALKSSPINKTFLPDNAKAAARFIETKDLPSPLVVEVIKIDFPSPLSPEPGSINSKLVRISLKDSAVLVLDPEVMAILSPDSECGMSPKNGIDVKSSMSFLECTFVSNKAFR